MKGFYEHENVKYDKKIWEELTKEQQELYLEKCVQYPHTVHSCDNFIGCEHTVMLHIPHTQQLISAHHNGETWNNIYVSKEKR
tara:strand:- start:46 stop:294 length:249 start_codon:yes stop_codon:yes gene_type:complete